MIKHSRGFTLIELIIAMALLSIVLATAIPQFSKYTTSSRRTTNINLFVSSLNLARSEAVTNNLKVSLCTSSNGATCDGNKSWDDGWLVFIDINGDGDVTVNTDTILRVFAKLYKRDTPKDVTFTERENDLKTVTYNEKGNLVGNQATFRRCADLGDVATNNKDARAIFVSPAGRVRLSKKNLQRDNATPLAACPV